MKRVFAPLSGREREAGARQHLASPVGCVNFSHIGRVSWQCGPSELANFEESTRGRRLNELALFGRRRAQQGGGQEHLHRRVNNLHRLICLAIRHLVPTTSAGCCGRSRPRPALDGHYANGGAPPGSCTRRGSLKVRPAKRTGHFYAKQRRRLHNEGFGRGF